VSTKSIKLGILESNGPLKWLNFMKLALEHHIYDALKSAILINIMIVSCVLERRPKSVAGGDIVLGTEVTVQPGVGGRWACSTISLSVKPAAVDPAMESDVPPQSAE